MTNYSLILSPIFSWDRRDIVRLTINGGHLDFQMYRGGGSRGLSKRDKAREIITTVLFHERKLTKCLEQTDNQCKQHCLNFWHSNDLRLVPTKVQNLRITAQSSTSLLVQWSPPAQINGILLGYMVRLPLLVLDCDQLTISLHFWSRHINVIWFFLLTVFKLHFPAVLNTCTRKPYSVGKKVHKRTHWRRWSYMGHVRLKYFDSYIIF